MANYIGDLILNSVQTGKEPTKTNQYQTKDNGPSFNDIFNKFNKGSAAPEQSKTVDNRPVKGKSNDDFYKNNKSVDNQNLKKDNDLTKKVFDKVKSTDVDNKDVSKDISNNKNQKTNLESAADAKKSDSSKVDDKMDPSSKATSDSKLVVKDENSSQVNDQNSKDDSSDSDDSLTKDNQESASNNSDSSTADDDHNTNTKESTVETTDAVQTSDVTQANNVTPTNDIAPTNDVTPANDVISINDAAPTNDVAPTNDTVQTNDNTQLNDNLSQLIAVQSQIISTSQPEPIANTSSVQNIPTINTESTKVTNPNIEVKLNQGLEDIVSNVDSKVVPKDDPSQNLIINTSNVMAEVDSSLQIKVSSDIHVNNDKIVNDKNLTILNGEMPLQQSILSELNAEVSDSSQNSGNSFLKQQNASEQVIKLSIEPLVTSNSVEFSNVIPQENNVPQTTIDKPQLSVLQTPVKELNQLDIMNQVNDKLATFKSSSNDKIEIILKPENLGKVNVEIQSIKGVISATLVAESQQVKEVLEKNIDSLRNNLSSQGLNLNNLNVKVEESNKSTFNNLNFGQGQFDSEANNHQQKSQNTYKADYKDNIGADNINRGTEEGTISTSELKNDNSLHVGMVDYKV